MKKDEKDLKEVIKQAILEAFAEMYGVTTVEGDTDDSAPEDGEDNGSSEGDRKPGEGSGNMPGTSEGGVIRPTPPVGVGPFSLR